ncbi:MAG: Gpr1/Fun34/YaaH family protein [uncultured Rubrobacteraceae bacterium]|uniref:Gpr1/Fun34/YaaH family protein n=1 Tax=uncultured Rubrobacteraceae bacterium TaxID=349277 RepID=A0A6J4QQP8_9ACTN|nr:MAG: Gpr1/Fun34/YaaH family protein [uncultured Rubrobacteraceae bacterium]
MDTQAQESSPARLYLQPIAAPSILGLYAFAGSTFIVSAHLAGWYGGPDTPLYLLPFAAVFGGIAQFAAGMWAYKARDAIATAMHGMWGSFWVGFGLLELLIAAGTIPANEGAFPAFGYWFIALAAITLMGTIAAAAENVALTLVLGTLTAGASVAAVAELIGTPPGQGWTAIAGYTFMISAILAWYTASALMFKGVGRPILPVGETKQAQQEPAVAPGASEPGVMKGQ